MKVGLVITTYNRVDYLREMITSLLSSDLSRLDCLCVVDDSSTEDIESVLDLFKLMKREVTLIRTPSNSGVFVSLRIGLDYLTTQQCDVLINLDSDAIVNKRWLDVLLNLHSKHPKDVVSGFNTLNNHPHIIETHDDHFVKETIGGINMVFSDTVYRYIVRPAFNALGFWDWAVCDNVNDYERKFIVSRPSVIEHIGIKSVLGHDCVDKALDFIPDEGACEL